MMDQRRQDLSDLKMFIESTDREVTMILQNFFWDQKHILEKEPLIGCPCNLHHKIPVKSKSDHEVKCYLTRHGYSLDEPFLPDPVDDTSSTLVKHSKQDIQNIIHAVAKLDRSFKTGKGCQGPEPLTADRLQQTYTADERRAIYNAVVKAAPFCHDLAELALGSGPNADSNKKKTRLEVLAELRDMRRRRVKYRVPSKTSNYSNVLKDVIKTQMDLYAESHGVFIKTEYGAKTYVSLNDEDSISRVNKTSEKFFIKQEKPSSEPEEEHNYIESTSERDRHRETHQQDRDRYYRENRNRIHHTSTESRSRDRYRSTSRHRGEHDDRSCSSYRSVTRHIKSDKPRAYRTENKGSDRSYDRHYSQSRYRNDDRNRYEERRRYDARNRNGHKIKCENIDKPDDKVKRGVVEVKQENMDINYDGNKSEYTDIKIEVKREISSEEYEDTDGDEDRERGYDKYGREIRNTDRENRLRDKHRMGEDRHQYDDHHRHRHRDEYKSRHEDRQRDEGGHRHESKNRDGDKHRHKKREKDTDSCRRHDYRNSGENSHRYEGEYRDRGQHSYHRHKDEERHRSEYRHDSSNVRSGRHNYYGHDTRSKYDRNYEERYDSRDNDLRSYSNNTRYDYDISRVKQEKED